VIAKIAEIAEIAGIGRAADFRRKAQIGRVLEPSRVLQGNELIAHGQVLIAGFKLVGPSRRLSNFPCGRTRMQPVSTGSLIRLMNLPYRVRLFSSDGPSSPAIDKNRFPAVMENMNMIKHQKELSSP
jgi:hypothetical protein